MRWRWGREPGQNKVLGRGWVWRKRGWGCPRRSAGNRWDISGWWGSGFSSHRHPGCRGERGLRKAGSQASALAVSVASPSQAGIGRLCFPCSFGVAQGPGVLLCGPSPGQVVRSAAHRRHLPRARHLGAGGFPFPWGLWRKAKVTWKPQRRAGEESWRGPRRGAVRLPGPLQVLLEGVCADVS